MRYSKLLLACLFLFAFSFSANSQTVDEVINKHVAAVGGLDKVMGIKTLKVTGNFSGMGAELPVTMTIKRDHKFRMDLSFQGMNMIQACDGTTGWSVNPFSGKKDAEKMNAEDLKEAIDNSEFEGKLFNYKEKGSKAELMGKEDMEGSEAYKIKLTTKDNDVSYIFLDATTYYIIKESSKRKFKEKEITQNMYPGNYQSFDGFMFPMSMEIKTDGSDQSQKATFTKVELNIDVDESIFKMPETKN